MKFTIKNRNNFFGRVVLIGSSGIISKNLQKKLKIEKIDHLVIGSKNINLLKSKSHISLKKKLKKNDKIEIVHFIGGG